MKLASKIPLLPFGDGLQFFPVGIALWALHS